MAKLQAQRQAERARTQKAIREAALRQRMEQKAADRINSAYQKLQLANQERLPTARDIEASRLQAMALEQLQKEDLLREQQQIATDQFLQDKLELDFMSSPLLTERDLAAEEVGTQIRIQQGLADLRTEAIARETEYQRRQIQFLVNLAREKRAALLVQKQQQIANEFKTYTWLRETNMLERVRQNLQGTVNTLNVEYAVNDIVAKYTGSNLVVLNQSITDTIGGVNSLNSLISLSALQTLYEIQAHTTAMNTIYTEVNEISLRIQTIIRELGVLSAQIESGSLQLPSLIEQRDFFVSQMRQLQSEIAGLEISISQQPDPNAESMKVFQALTGIQSAINAQLNSFETQISGLLGRLPGVQTAYQSAIAARQAAVVNSAAALQAAQQLAAADVLNFEDDYTATLIAYTGAQTTTQNIKGTRDGFQALTQQLQRAWSDTYNGFYIPALNLYTSQLTNVFNPREQAALDAATNLELIRGRIRTIDDLYNLSRGDLAILGPIVSGGYPLRPQELISLEATVKNIRDTIDITFPETLSRLATTAATTLVTANTIYLLIQAPSGIYYVAELISKPPSDHAMQDWTAADQLYSGLMTNLGVLDAARIGAIANRLTFERANGKQNAMFLKTLFALQMNGLNAARVAAQSRPTDAQATRDGSSLDSILTDTGSLSTKIQDLTTAGNAIETFINQISDLFTQFATSDQTQDLLVALRTLWVFTNFTLNPQIGVVQGLSQAIQERSGDMGRLLPSLEPLQTAKDTAWTPYNGAITTRDGYIGERDGVESRREFARLTKTLANELLKVQNVRVAAKLMAIGRREFYRGLLTGFQEVGPMFARNTLLPTQIRDGTQAFVGSIDGTQTSLDQKQAQRDPLDPAISNLETIQLPSAIATRDQANQELYFMFAGTDPRYAQIILIRGEIGRIGPLLDQANQDIGTTGTLVRDESIVMGTISNRDNLFVALGPLLQSRNDAFTPYDTRTTWVGTLTGEKSNLEGIQESNILYRSNLYAIKFMLENYNRIKFYAEGKRGAYRALYDSSNGARISANLYRTSVVFDPVGLDQQAILDFAALPGKIAERDSLPTELDPNDSELLRLQGLRIQASNGLRQTLDFFRRIALDQDLAAVLKTIGITQSNFDAFVQNYLNPQTGIIRNGVEMSANLTNLQTLLTGLFESRRIAKSDYDIAMANLKTAQWVMSLYRSAVDLEQVQRIRPKAKADVQLVLDRYKGLFVSTDGARTGAASLKSIVVTRPESVEVLQARESISSKLGQIAQTQTDGIDIQIGTATTAYLGARQEIRDLDSGTDLRKAQLAGLQEEIRITGAILDGANQDVTNQSGVVRTNGQTQTQVLPDLTGLKAARDGAKENLDGVTGPRDDAQGAKNGLDARIGAYRQMKQTAQDLANSHGPQVLKRIEVDGIRQKYSSSFTSLDGSRITASQAKTSISVPPAVGSLLDTQDSLKAAIEQESGVSSQIETLGTTLGNLRGSVLEYRQEMRYLEAGTDPKKIQLVNIQGQIDLTEGLLEDANQDVLDQGGVVSENGQTQSQVLPDLTGVQATLKSASAALDGATDSRDLAEIAQTNLEQELASREAMLSAAQDLLARQESQSAMKAQLDGIRQAYSEGVEGFNQSRVSSSQFKTVVATPPAVDIILESANTLDQKIEQKDTVSSQLTTVGTQLQTLRENASAYRQEIRYLDAGTDSRLNELVNIQGQIEITEGLLEDANQDILDQSAVVEGNGRTQAQILPDLTGVRTARDDAKAPLDTAIDSRDGAQRSQDDLDARIDANQALKQVAQDLKGWAIARAALREGINAFRTGFQNLYTAFTQTVLNAPPSVDYTAADTALAAFQNLIAKQDLFDGLKDIDVSEYDRMVAYFKEMYTLADLGELMARIQLIQNQLNTFKETDMGTLEGVLQTTNTTLQTQRDNLANIAAMLQAAYNAKRDAQANLDTANESRVALEGSRDGLLLSRQSLIDLIGVLQSFNDVVIYRWADRATVRGKIEFYKNLVDFYNRERIDSMDRATTATLNLGNTSANLTQDITDAQNLASQLVGKVENGDALNQAIQNVLDQIQNEQGKMDDVYRQRMNDPVGQLKNLLSDMLRIQQALNETQSIIDTINGRIQIIINQMNDPNLNQEMLAKLAAELKLLQELMAKYQQQLENLQNLLRDLQARILELLREIQALRNLQTQLRARLPIIGFVPYGILAAATAAAVIRFGFPGFFFGTGKAPSDTSEDCVKAKQRGYKDGFASGKKDGYKKGYADAKADFDANMRRGLAAGIQDTQEDTSAQAQAQAQAQQQQAFEAQEEDEDMQQGGQVDEQGLEQQEEQQQEEEGATPLMTPPQAYQPIMPYPLPIPGDAAIKVPTLPGVSAQYQQCYKEGYLAGYKAGFEEGYVSGFKAFRPYLLGSTPPVQEQPEETTTLPVEEAEALAPAFEPEPEQAAPTAFQVPDGVQMDEAYRNRFNQIRMSQF